MQCAWGPAALVLLGCLLLSHPSPSGSQRMLMQAGWQPALLLLPLLLLLCWTACVVRPPLLLLAQL